MEQESIRLGLPAQPHTLTAGEACTRLGVTAQGLSSAEIGQRRQVYGYNTLPSEKPPAVWVIFLRQFLNPLIYILLFAAAISLLLREWTDAGFIFAVLVLNAVIGTIQEYQAQKSAAALQRLVTYKTQVIRDGVTREIPSRELVPGDVILVESGNKVPADIRLLSEQGLEVDESLLTGESLSNAKSAEISLAPDTAIADRSNMAYAGTLILRGRGRGVVVATARATELGKIAEEVVSGVRVKPPLQQRMEKFTGWVGLAYVSVVLVIGVIAWSQGTPFTEILLIAAALAVAAIPEGLPVAITVALAVGMSRMARRHVIIRRLVAAETLGSCTFIAADKTGTLTVNELTVKRLQLPGEAPWEVSGEGMTPDGDVHIPIDAPDNAGALLLRIGRTAVLCNEAILAKQEDGWRHHGDAVDVALLVFAHKTGTYQSDINSAHPQLAAIPFESEHLFAASLNRVQDRLHLSVKGAFERVLPMCTTMATARGDLPIDRDYLEHQAEILASQGFRVLVLAEGNLGEIPEEGLKENHLSDLTFLGLVGMMDPPRPEAAAAIADCQRAGVAVSMVTGDHPITAFAVARELGLLERPEQVVIGRQLREMRDIDRKKYQELVVNARVFARVEPHDKTDIVHALMAAGHFVAVTGDGANDAPALRAAHVGVAMGEKGTDVARESADIIITDDNFASLVAGIKEGRVAYANVRKVIFLLISTGAVEVVFFILALMAGLPLPLTAVQLLWLNLVTQGIQDVGLAFEPEEGDEMQRPPRPPRQPIFDRVMIERCLITGVAMAIVAFSAYWWMLDNGMSIDAARNSTLLLMVLFENVQVFNSRSETRSAFRHNPLRNRLLLFGTLSAQLVHIAAMYTPGLRDILDLQPVSMVEWLLLLGLALVVLVVMEFHKFIYRKQAL